ncbi:hypothetical protein CBS147339_9761 [Penicillium roqueforti]|nr:hypothetical protein LCP963914a_6641 [Penicillium roqueforti]KAI3062937.1 hypothetical protein CBS147339_9761 [Penicillium roqueforti]KAI3128731.1 hypothetical protein CBS147325_9788 [Penicillium roqueforti]KAI3176129.1 hypothetical protein DTO032C6_9852 [Penicillium roqueforti]KAI3219591.1 hypothetical protein DTO012A7_9681 [Penicillium roqueforti]
MTVTYPLDTPLSRNPVIAVTVLGALATITTALRFWALEMRRMSPEASEYIILAALLLDYGRGNGHQYDEEKFWTRSTLHRALPFPAIGGPLSQSPLGSTELEVLILEFTSPSPSHHPGLSLSAEHTQAPISTPIPRFAPTHNQKSFSSRIPT